MRRPLTIQQKRFPEVSRNERYSVELDDVDRQIRTKLDRRNIIEYTFTSGEFEDINHILNRLPKGAAIVTQSAAGIVTSEVSSWDKKKLRMKSSVFPNTVRIQLS